VERTRKAVAGERAVWLSVLEDLQLNHSEPKANFIFFDAHMPQPEFAAALFSQGIDIGRPHPPYANWARITIGLPEENQRAQDALRRTLEQTA
jgi:histidinol-phosphate aminotransferase